MHHDDASQMQTSSRLDDEPCGIAAILSSEEHPKPTSHTGEPKPIRLAQLDQESRHDRRASWLDVDRRLTLSLIVEDDTGVPKEAKIGDLQQKTDKPPFLTTSHVFFKDAREIAALGWLCIEGLRDILLDSDICEASLYELHTALHDIFKE